MSFSCLVSYSKYLFSVIFKCFSSRLKPFYKICAKILIILCMVDYDYIINFTLFSYSIQLQNQYHYYLLLGENINNETFYNAVALPLIICRKPIFRINAIVFVLQLYFSGLSMKMHSLFYCQMKLTPWLQFFL